MIRGGCAVGKEEALKPAIVCLAHRGMDTDIRRYTRDDNVLNHFLPEQHVEIGTVERTFSRLVDDGFAGFGRQLRNDVPARFSAREDASAGAWIAYTGAYSAAPPVFIQGQIREVGTMSFSSVHDVKTELSHGIEDPLNRFEGSPRHRKIISHPINVASLAAEVRLHVDYQEYRILRPEVAVIGPGIGVGFDVLFVHR